MKSYIVLMLLMPFMLSCSKPHKKAINDFGLHSYFVAVEITNGEREFMVVIENSVLYSIINTNDNLTQDRYQKVIYQSIKNEIPFEVHDDILLELKEYEVIYEKGIDILRRRGINELLDAYFKDGVQCEDLADIPRRYLIFTFFKEGILVKIDDESGLLVAHYSK